MSGSGWQADFAVHCSQCGGDDFVEIFPVPARVCRVYERGSRDEGGRELTASVYACQQCGHLEWFVDPTEWARNAPRAALPSDPDDA